MIHYYCRFWRQYMNIQKGLIDWGLNGREARIYNTLVARVESTVYKLSLETKIPRTTVYEVLESLTNKSLVSFSRKNGIKYYFAESPNRLLRILEDKMTIAKELIPLLSILPNERMLNPTVKLYFGPDGRKRVFDDILDTCERTGERTILAIPSSRLYLDQPKYMKGWIKKREEMGIKTLLIAEDNPEHKAPDIYPNNASRETRLIVPEFISDTAIDIYADKIALLSEVNGLAHSIIIESPSVTATLKKFFMFMWTHAIKPTNIE